MCGYDNNLISLRHIQDAEEFVEALLESLHSPIHDEQIIWALKQFMVDCESRDRRLHALDLIETRPAVIQWYAFMGYRYLAYNELGFSHIRGEYSAGVWSTLSNMYRFTIPPTGAVPDVKTECKLYGDCALVEGIGWCHRLYFDEPPRTLQEIVESLLAFIQDPRYESDFRDGVTIRITWEGYLRLWVG